MCAGLNNGRRTAGTESAQHGITACRFAAAVKLPGCVFLCRSVTAAACFGQNASLNLSDQSAVKIMRLSRSFGFAIPLTYHAKALNFTVLYGHRFFYIPFTMKSELCSGEFYTALFGLTLHGG